MSEYINKIDKMAHHRNGVSGQSFTVVMFENAGNKAPMLAVVFDDTDKHVAVFDFNLLKQGVIEFGPNSFRGDNYERELRAFIEQLT